MDDKPNSDSTKHDSSYGPVLMEDTADDDRIVYRPATDRIKPPADHRDWQTEMERIGQQLAQLQIKHSKCHCQGITTK